MKLYRLETVSWSDSQLLYHALPRIGREGLNLLSPASPYVCIGYFQDVEQEVDLDYCRAHNIPVFRREVGGGAVYLDGEQLFYQLVIRKNHPLVPKEKGEFYWKFLQAPIAAYRALGIPAEYKPVNDIIASGRKISGNGVAEIGDYIVFVGNLIVDFDYETMVRVLRDFRDGSLATNFLGRAFIRFYYDHSPALADWIVSRSSADRVAPPRLGAPDRGLPPLGPAPGTYVHQR